MYWQKSEVMKIASVNELVIEKLIISTRQNIHLSFWGLGNIERQRDFIVTNVFSIEAIQLKQ